MRHNWRATVGFKKILFPQQSLKSLVFNANTPQRAWAVLATCFLLLKVALWCIRTNWFNMCSPSLMCQSCRKGCKASTANVQWFSNQTPGVMTLSPVSHSDVAAHVVVFTVVVHCGIVELFTLLWCWKHLPHQNYTFFFHRYVSWWCRSRPKGL